jgi:hypothetical protein
VERVVVVENNNFGDRGFGGEIRCMRKEECGPGWRWMTVEEVKDNWDQCRD